MQVRLLSIAWTSRQGYPKALNVESEPEDENAVPFSAIILVLAEPKKDPISSQCVISVYWKEKVVEDLDKSTNF
jgi:hypothetical protein